MPIYEYRCTNGHRFEAFQSMSEDPLSVCAECGAASERVLSAPAIHYKGSGFYTTDYARKGKQTGAGEGNGSGGSSKDSGSGSDSSGSGSDSSGSSTGSSDSGSSTGSGSGSGSKSGSGETKASGSD